MANSSDAVLPNRVNGIAFAFAASMYLSGSPSSEAVGGVAQRAMAGLVFGVGRIAAGETFRVGPGEKAVASKGSVAKTRP